MSKASRRHGRELRRLVLGKGQLTRLSDALTEPDCIIAPCRTCGRTGLLSRWTRRCTGQVRTEDPRKQSVPRIVDREESCERRLG